MKVGGVKVKKTMYLLVCILLITSLIFAGCSNPQSEETKNGTNGESDEKVFKVGINNFGQANFFARIGKASLEDQIMKNGGEVLATVNADVPGRMASIENMISQGVDAIIIQEGDINQLAPALMDAEKKGIIIGSMDAGDADFVDIFVESDNNQLGAMAAEKMVELIGEKGNVVEIFSLFLLFTFDSLTYDIACSAHTFTHSGSPSHRLHSVICCCLSFVMISIHPNGHDMTQALHPIHLFLSTSTAPVSSFLSNAPATQDLIQ